MFAVVLSLACYALQPEILILLLLCLFVFVVVLLAQTAWFDRQKLILRPLLYLVLSAVAGVALAAPLLLPGLQIAGETTLAHTPFDTSSGLPTHNLLYFIFQSFDWLQISGSYWFGPANGYVETSPTCVRLRWYSLRRCPPFANIAERLLRCSEWSS